jgi:hypothetical protein
MGNEVPLDRTAGIPSASLSHDFGAFVKAEQACRGEKAIASKLAAIAPWRRPLGGRPSVRRRPPTTFLGYFSRRPPSPLRPTVHRDSRRPSAGRQGQRPYPPEHRSPTTSEWISARARLDAMVLSGMRRADGRLRPCRGTHLAPTIHAGFDGFITLEVINHGPFDLKLVPHRTTMCQYIFERLSETPGCFSEGG